MAVDAAGRSRWEDRLFHFVLAGGDPEDFTPYESSVSEAFSDAMHEALERELESHPMIRHVT